MAKGTSGGKRKGGKVSKTKSGDNLKDVNKIQKHQQLVQRYNKILLNM